VRAAALLLALAACGGEVDLPENAERDAPAHAELAVAVAVAEWSGRADVDLGEPPPVRWFDGRCLEYAGEPPLPPGHCLRGLYTATWRDTQIHLAWGDTPDASALAHELLHWTLDSAGRRDEDHADPLWAQVPEVNAAIAEAMPHGNTATPTTVLGL
jgi:hypothetical protein